MNQREQDIYKDAIAALNRISENETLGQHYSNGCTCKDEATIRAALEQAAQAQQPSEQEPVGYLNVSRFRGSNAMVNTDFDYSGNLPDGNYPVYTHPAPQRKPLTDEQIEDLFPDSGTEMELGEWALFIVRAVEKAHGIEAAITKGEKP